MTDKEVFYENRQLSKRWRLNNDGLLHGFYKSYHGDGRVREKGHYLNGEKDGYCEEDIYDDGILSKFNYKN